MTESVFETKGRVYMSTFYQFVMDDIDGEAVSFDRYRGNVCLIYNTASEWGYTPQHGGLEQLFEQYKEDGLRILGFPCNQFAEEEPGSDQEIKEFCQTNFGVTFDLFSKIKVKGTDQTPLWEWLTSRENPWGPHKVRWNFQKYLIDRQGIIRRTFDPIVEPDDPLLVDSVEKCLAETM